MKIFPDLIHKRPHLSAAVALGAASAPFLPDAWRLTTRVLAGWDVAVWAYLLTMGWMMMRADHRKVKRVAAQEDEKAPLILAVLCVAAVLSLLAIVSELSALRAGKAQAGNALAYALVGLTLVGSWFLVGVLFCFHYAHLYYQSTPNARPLQFPGPHHEPDYWDFLYFSFTISVAAQTSDVAVHSARLRKLVLGQSVLSFFFNLVILGLSVNIAAGLMNK